MSGRNDRAHFPHLLEMAPGIGEATRETLELLWRAAPEQAAELDNAYFAGVQVRRLLGASTGLRSIYNAIQIPEEALCQIWLLAHAAWHEFCVFYDNPPEKLGAHPLIEQAVATAKSIGAGQDYSWPPQIPAFREARPGNEAKAVREIFAMACAWALLHELRHTMFYNDPARPADIIYEELQCDRYALDFLFSQIEQNGRLTGEAPERVRGKRAISTLVGLYYVARLSAEGQRDSHPHVQERIKLLFDKVADLPAIHFWDFAMILILALNRNARDKPGKEGMSSREIATVALNYPFP